MAGSAVDATAATPSAAAEEGPLTFDEAVPKFVEITRQQVIQFGVSLSGMAPLSVCQSASRTDPPSAANTDPPKVGEMSLRLPLRALQRRSAIAASGSISDADSA
jgi:hypothetical protein